MPVDNYVDNENWPETWSLCRLQGQLLNPDGSAAVGKIFLKPVPTAVYTDSHIILPRSIEIELDGDGAFDYYIPATDDPDINPTDWNYRVTERVSNGRSYYIDAPGGVTLNLADAAPVPSSPGNAVTYSQEVSTDEGNVLTLGTDGRVFASAGDLGGGVDDHGDLTGLADDDHPQYLTAARAAALHYTEAETDALLAAKASTAALTAHEADTTNIHGIADTAALATTAALTAHAADTTDIHGIADTSALVVTTDARLSNARTPTAHATSHQFLGSDVLELDGSQIGSGQISAEFLPFPIRAVQDTEPDADGEGWAADSFWYDTSTE